MQYTVDWMEQKKTSTGKDLKKCTLKDEQGSIIDSVSVWGDYPGFSSIMPGSTVLGEIKSNEKGYKSLYPEKTNTLRSGSGIKAAQERKAEFIEKAQDRKNESIAYFNSLNSAIALFPHLYEGTKDTVEVAQFINFWRDWFLEEWKKYESGDTRDKHRAF